MVAISNKRALLATLLGILAWSCQVMPEAPPTSYPAPLKGGLLEVTCTGRVLNGYGQTAGVTGSVINVDASRTAQSVAIQLKAKAATR